MADDLTEWSCTSTPAGLIGHPRQLASSALEWIPAQVPGTAAGARLAAGKWTPDQAYDFDAEDWWFRWRFPAGDVGADSVLSLDGIATIADVWLNGEHILSSTNMFRAYQLELKQPLLADNELVVRCAALGPALAERRPRPRWKSRLVSHQNLRWIRTALLGRLQSVLPAIAVVGPWRPVTLRPVKPVEVSAPRVTAVLDGTVGRVELTAMVRTTGCKLLGATLVAGGHPSQLEVRRLDDGWVVTGHTVVPGPRLWWPATHGAQPLYEVRLECHTTVGDHTVELGRTGFRSLGFRSAEDPELVVNGVAIFCRGGCWTPLDPVGLVVAKDDLRAALEQVRAAGLNMVRIIATTTYETADFFDLCDELGILVWQDLMFTAMDYPSDDPMFLKEAIEEVTGVLAGLGRHPCLAAVSGGSEVTQQAVMVGQPITSSWIRFFEGVLADLVLALAPGTPYWPDTPTGGSLPFTVDVGLSHYFGVGGYRRPLNDARLSGVRFAAECLCFSHLPNDEAIDEFLMDGHAMHDPAWKRGVPRDAGASWDTEDTRDHYVRELYGVDPDAVRIGDPDRYLQLGRAATAEVLARTFSEWRRPLSSCHGAIVLSLRDLFPGAGTGIIDSMGRPKSAYYRLRRVLGPTALLLSDEGLNGLDVWMLNDGPDAVDGVLTVRSFSGEVTTARSETTVILDPHSFRRFQAQQLLGGFVDVTYAYRFGPPGVDAVAVHWHADGRLLAHAVYWPEPGPVEPAELGLQALAREVSEGRYVIEVTSRRLARCVVLAGTGCEFSDNWFDIEPGGCVLLEATCSRPWRARARALNSLTAMPITIEDAQRAGI